MEDRHITVDQAAELFGLPRWVLYRWVRARELVPVEVLRGPGRRGRVAYYRLSEVAGLAAERHAETSRNDSE